MGKYVIESPELKALELFIAEKNSEILCRFDGLLQQQQLVESLVRTLAPEKPGVLLNSQLDDLPSEMPIIDASVDQELKEKLKETKVVVEAMESPSVSTSLPVSRRNTYEIAKEESHLHRQKIEALNELAGVISEESPKSKKEEVKNTMLLWQFEFFFAAVLVSNAIFLGVQTEWAAINLNKDLPVPFTIVHSIYAILFVAEMIWRVSLSGCHAFLCSSDWAWHWLDIAVTFSAVFDVIATLAGFAALTGGSNSGFRLLRVMKIARLVRVIRIIKVLRFVRALRVLVFSIIHTMRSLVWSLVLLFVIMYSFGILFADAITEHLLEHGDALPQQTADGLVKHFGSLVTSMNTLFRAISGGVTWEVPAEFLLQVGGEWVMVFTFYIAFCCFAVLNVMTGVFCHSAISGAEKDQDLVIQALMHEKENIRKRLLELFKQVDDDNSGTITLDEFERRFEEESVKNLFESLDLGTSDAWTLFQILDMDCNRYIDVTEFVDSCIRHRGSAKCVDVVGLTKQVRKVRDELSKMSRAQERILKEFKTTQKTFLV